MIHLTLPHPDYRPLPFYLAMEHFAATISATDEYFFTWVVNPTVIIGRNQDLHAEVDVKYCRENHIDMVRRKSGGGCVYAHAGNLMLSYITHRKADVSTIFSDYTRKVVSALRAMGIDAEASGRNDVCLHGAKISGNAFQHLSGCSLVHGTLLHTLDTEHIQHAITPSKAKLSAKGVVSVESRITSISNHYPDLTLEGVRDNIIKYFTNSEIMLTPDHIATIETMAADYRREGWLEHAGRSHTGVAARKYQRYIPGVGTVQINIGVDAAGVIDNAWLTGDYLDELNGTPLCHNLKGHIPSTSLINNTFANIINHYNP